MTRAICFLLLLLLLLFCCCFRLDSIELRIHVLSTGIWLRVLDMCASFFVLTEADSCRLELPISGDKYLKTVCKNAVALAYYGSCRLPPPPVDQKVNLVPEFTCPKYFFG